MSTQPMKVLVVDDEQGVRMVIARIVERLGGVSLLAPDGETALSMLDTDEGRAVEVIILDLSLPGYEPLNLVKAFREKSPKVGVLVVTGYELAEAQEILELPRTGFLQKPFAMVDFTEQLQAVAGATVP